MTSRQYGLNKSAWDIGCDLHDLALVFWRPHATIDFRVSAAARGDLRAYEDSVRLPNGEVVARLRDLLGARLVSYLGSVKETRAVRLWADGQREPSAQTMRRLRAALHAAELLAEKDSPAVVQAWFQGMNPHLGDAAPARMLREDDLDTAGPAVLGAARSFAAQG